ncbi:nicotinate-nucleotide adenylyltransferase [Candidatus Moduliflexota bacterium]
MNKVARGKEGPAGLRIGVYGGTFSPVHTAHLILAEEIRERMALESVLFVPSGVPPHKNTSLPGGEERLAMTRLAVRGNPFFSVLDTEVRRPGHSYTVETLRELRDRFGKGAVLFFLIGMDAFREITTWHEAGALPALAHFVIFPRPGHPVGNPARQVPSSWEPGPPGKKRAGITPWPVAGGKSIYTVETDTYPLSASAIRRRLRRGRSVKYLVPDAVERYIRKNNLYGA